MAQSAPLLGWRITSGPTTGSITRTIRSRDHGEDHRDRVALLTRLQLQLIAAERATIVRLRNAGTIGDDVLLRVQRDLDLEEVRLGQS